MSSAKITLYGFQHYLNLKDDDLFIKLSLPAGIDKKTLTENIIIKGAEFEVLYSDPYFMQEIIGTWSNKWYRTFEKWITALNIEYNPLENYDRVEEWNESDNGSNHTASTGTSTDSSTGSGSSNTNNTVSAYNSSTYENDSASDISTSNATSGTTNISNTGDATHSNTNVKTGRAHGNIGVTTSQQMLQSELDIATWNIYEHITDIFLSEFVIQIY